MSCPTLLYGFRLTRCLLCLKSFSACLTVCLFNIGHNVLQLPEGRNLYHKTSFGELNFRLAQMCLRSTKPRLLGRCCYAFVVLFLSWFVCPFCCVFVRWLGSSFEFFSFELCVGKKCKCATECVGYFK